MGVGLDPGRVVVGPVKTGAVRRVLRRHWQRVKTALRAPRVRLIYDPAYESNVWSVPLDPLRADRILAFLTEERLLRRENIALPRQAALKNILLVHSQGYLERLQEPATLASILGVPVGDEELEGVLDLQRLMVGGTIHATRLALAGCCTGVNLGGGFHHASRDRGAGFCVFNDVAIAIARLRARGFAGRVLIIDLDLHDGNGTREIFAHDESVHTFSIHNEHWGDTDGAATTSIALHAAVEDEAFLGTLLLRLPPVIEAHRPELVFYLAGCDVAADDAIGNWRLTAEGIFARDRLVVELVRRVGAPLVVTLAGGYGDKAWRYSARFLSWLIGGARLEPPEGRELALIRLRQLKTSLDPNTLAGQEERGGWQLTEEDLAGILPGIATQTRFLGHLTKVGLELLLERAGMFRLLRARGFPHPVVHLDLDHSLGETLKIFADSHSRELLVELRVHVSGRIAPGFSMLAVEWMLLQNPRAGFSRQRPRLPGQSHPGLGLLADFFSWLVVLCENLSLDGMSFRPSHYHLAVTAQRHARFLDPEHQAVFEAMQELLGALPLDVASTAVEEGRVRDAGGAVVRWGAWPLVVPATDRFREVVWGVAYETARRAHKDRLSFTLAAPVDSAPALPGGR